jgi:hypothetical protein
MAKAHDVLKMWKDSQNLGATQVASHAAKKQMTVVGYISDTEEIINISLSNLEHDGASAFEMSGRSPVPPELPAKNQPE